jgi:hypothetical protein
MGEAIALYLQAIQIPSPFTQFLWRFYTTKQPAKHRFSLMH